MTAFLATAFLTAFLPTAFLTAFFAAFFFTTFLTALFAVAFFVAAMAFGLESVESPAIAALALSNIPFFAAIQAPLG